MQSLAHTQSPYESNNSTEPYSYFKPKERWLSCLPEETMLRGLSSLCVCMLTGKFRALWPFLTDSSTFLAKMTKSSSVSWEKKKKKKGWPRAASVCNHTLSSTTEYKDQEKQQKSKRNTPVTGNVEFATCTCKVQTGKKPAFAIPSAQGTIFLTQKNPDMIKWKFWRHC